MVAGLIHLVTNSGTSASYWLTENPQITLFKTVYRRHTPFAREMVAVKLSVNPDFGQTGVLKLPMTSDLIYRIILTFKLPQLEAVFINSKSKDIQHVLKTYPLTNSRISKRLNGYIMLTNDGGLDLGVFYALEDEISYARKSRQEFEAMLRNLSSSQINLAIPMTNDCDIDISTTMAEAQLDLMNSIVASKPESRPLYQLFQAAYVTEDQTLQVTNGQYLLQLAVTRTTEMLLPEVGIQDLIDTEKMHFIKMSFDATIRVLYLFSQNVPMVFIKPFVLAGPCDLYCDVHPVVIGANYFATVIDPNYRNLATSSLPGTHMPCEIDSYEAWCQNQMMIMFHNIMNQIDTVIEAYRETLFSVTNRLFYDPALMAYARVYDWSYPSKPLMRDNACTISNVYCTKAWNLYFVKRLDDLPWPSNLSASRCSLQPALDRRMCEISAKINRLFEETAIPEEMKQYVPPCQAEMVDLWLVAPQLLAVTFTLYRSDPSSIIDSFRYLIETALILDPLLASVYKGILELFIMEYNQFEFEPEIDAEDLFIDFDLKSETDIASDLLAKLLPPHLAQMRCAFVIDIIRERQSQRFWHKVLTETENLYPEVANHLIRATQIMSRIPEPHILPPILPEVLIPMTLSKTRSTWYFSETNQEYLFAIGYAKLFISMPEASNMIDNSLCLCKPVWANLKANHDYLSHRELDISPETYMLIQRDSFLAQVEYQRENWPSISRIRELMLNSELKYAIISQLINRITNHAIDLGPTTTLTETAYDAYQTLPDFEKYVVQFILNYDGLLMPDVALDLCNIYISTQQIVLAALKLQVMTPIRDLTNPSTEFNENVAVFLDMIPVCYLPYVQMMLSENLNDIHWTRFPNIRGLIDIASESGVISVTQTLMLMMSLMFQDIVGAEKITVVTDHILSNMHDLEIVRSFIDDIQEMVTRALIADNQNLLELKSIRRAFRDILYRNQLARCTWVENLAENLVEWIEFRCADTVFATHKSTVFHSYAQLFIEPGIKAAYRKIIGNRPELTTFNFNPKPETEIALPLIFYFNRNSHIALPMNASLHTNYQIVFKLRNLDEVSYRERFSEFITGSAHKPRISGYAMVEQIFLGQQERARFASGVLEYLTDFTQYDDFTAKQSQIIHKYRFHSPSKLLVMTIQPEVHINPELRTNDKSYFYGERQWNNYSMESKFDLCLIDSAKKAHYMRVVGRYIRTSTEYSKVKSHSKPRNIYAPILRIKSHSLKISPEENPLFIELFHTLIRSEVNYPIIPEMQPQIDADLRGVDPELVHRRYNWAVVYTVLDRMFQLIDFTAFRTSQEAIQYAARLGPGDEIIAMVANHHLASNLDSNRDLILHANLWADELMDLLIHNGDLHAYYLNLIPPGILEKSVVEAAQLNLDVFNSEHMHLIDYRKAAIPRIPHPPLIQGFLSLNGHSIMPENSDASMWGDCEALRVGLNAPNIGMYLKSWALVPKLYQPTGSLNLSKIDDFETNLELNSKIVTDNPARIETVVWSLDLVRYISGMCGKAFNPLL